MVSIIIPAYNAEKFIEKAIGSALAQTYENVEVIVVNDGSKDATQAIVEVFAQNNPKIKLISVPNGGVSRARNIGLDNATGEYVMFLDADDALFPDTVEKMKNCLEQTGVDICTTRAVSVTSHETQIRRNTDERVVIWDSKTALLKAIEDHGATHAVWAKLYRKNKLTNIRFPEGKGYHEDSYFVFSCLYSGMSMAQYHFISYKYFVSENSVSRSGFSEKMFVMVELAEEKVKMIADTYPEYKEKSTNMLIKAHMALLNNLCRHKGNTHRAQEKAGIRFICTHKQAFIPASRFDKIWFFIITHHLYDIYKLAYHTKQIMRQ